MFTLEKKFWKKFDFMLFFTVILLNIYGIISIYVASIKADGGVNIHYVKVQMVAFSLGLIAIFFLTLFDYNTFGKLYLMIYGFCNLLLVAVLLFGTGEEQWGARSWLVIGPFSFQPAELVKIGTILSVGKYIDEHRDKINDLYTLGKILVFALIPVALIMLQPDFGTAIVFVFFIVVMLFTAGLDWKYFLYAGVLGSIGVVLMYFFYFGEYQKNRIRVFFNPSLDALGSGYHVSQSKIAIGSGQKIGRLLADEANFVKTGWLPESHTDFIFSVIGENFGLLGGVVLLGLYFLLIFRLIEVAKRAKDGFGSLVVIGITSMITFHIIQNIGMTMGLMPVTGIPLPFISYGGTFLLSNLISIGIVLSIGIRKNKINF